MNPNKKAKLEASGFTIGDAEQFVKSMLTETGPTTCSLCAGKTKYNMQWDAYYCDSCNRWEEPICSNRKCYLCQSRPEKPSMLPIKGEKQ